MRGTSVHVSPVQHQSGRSGFRRAASDRTQPSPVRAATLVARGFADPSSSAAFPCPLARPRLARPLFDSGLGSGCRCARGSYEARRAYHRIRRLPIWTAFRPPPCLRAACVRSARRRRRSSRGRFEEGYGITEASIARLRTLDPGFVVTVDCGIACKAEAAALVEAWHRRGYHRPSRAGRSRA